MAFQKMFFFITTDSILNIFKFCVWLRKFKMLIYFIKNFKIFYNKTLFQFLKIRINQASESRKQKSKLEGLFSSDNSFLWTACSCTSKFFKLSKLSL